MRKAEKGVKANFVIGKKQIILSALIVILGGAIYLNFLYGGKDLKVTDAVADADATASVVESQAEGDPKDTETENKNYGDATLVNGLPEGGADYFSKASLNKEKSRDEAVETVKSVIAGADVSEEEVAQATAKIVELSEQISSEDKMESLIKAKGFTECLVYLDGEAANVVVQSEGLTAEQAAQIKNIVLNEKSVPQENISITEISAQ